MVNIQKCQKNWWAPVWKGLVIDPEGKHCRTMKNALWLFLYFLLNADRKKGFLLRKVKTITSDMGVKRDTVLRWFKILRRGGYVSTRNTGRCLLIQIEKWKPLSEVGNLPHEMFEISNIRSWKNPTSGDTREVQNHVHFDPKTPAPNDITIKKNILNNDIDKNSCPYSNFKAYKAKAFRPRDDKDRLALDMARSLNDLQGLPLYLSYSRKYPQSLLIEVFEKVKEMPDQKIKKSRGALFNHLIQRYAKNAS
jgi:hypothetical protein